MRLALFALVLLLSVTAEAQRIRMTGGSASGSGGASTGTACGLASSGSAFAASFRGTSATNLVPVFACDALLTSCVKFGPGQDTGVGVNTSGETIFGRTGQTTGVWRFWGTGHWLYLNAQTLTISSFAQVAFLLQTSTGAAENQNANKPWRVNDAEGFQNTCKATLPTCGTVPESTEVAICGTGGALTKRCYCTSNGTAFAWRNTLNPSAGAGTATTCPDTV